MQREIDAADRLPALADFIAELAGAALEDPPGDGGACTASEIAFDLPFELDLLEEQGVWQLDAAPPTQKLETTLMPVWHRVRIRVSLDDGRSGISAVES